VVGEANKIAGRSGGSDSIAAAFGGSGAGRGRATQHAHQGRPVTREHIQAFVERRFATLQECDFTDEDRYAIIARINPCAVDVYDAGSAPSE
jgi:truncated hemoglobin YjbI